MIKEKSNLPYSFKYKADDGDLNSMLIYGRSCMIELNKMKEAAKYFKMAADKGNFIGFHNYIYLSVLFDKISNKEECRHYVEKAIELYHDHPVILYSCGYCYLYGKCGEINYKTATELFKLSSDLGFPNAMYNYGVSLFTDMEYQLIKKKGLNILKKQLIWM